MAIKCDLRDKWHDALVSGVYQQGQCHLQHDDMFCCLGVLAEVMGLESRTNTRLDGVIDYLIEDRWIDGGDDFTIGGLTREQVNLFIKLNDDELLGFDDIAAEVARLDCDPL